MGRMVYIYIYMYLCIYICAHVHAGAHLSVQLYMLRPKLNIKWLPQLFSIFNFWTSVPHWIWCPSDSPVFAAHPWAGLGLHTVLDFYIGVTRIKLCSSYLYCKHFLEWGISSSNTLCSIDGYSIIDCLLGKDLRSDMV